MKKQLKVVLLCLCLIVSLAPITALAANEGATSSLKNQLIHRKQKTARRRRKKKIYEKMIKNSATRPVSDDLTNDVVYGTRSELKHDLQFKKTIGQAQTESDTKKEENKI